MGTFSYPQQCCASKTPTLPFPLGTRWMGSRVETYPLHFMISGPSNEKGSPSSGSDFIMYFFVKIEFLK